VIVREGTGFGQAQSPNRGDAHERAIKAAETDATKRALVTFGGRFGLLLHDRERGDRSTTKRSNGGHEPVTEQGLFSLTPGTTEPDRKAGVPAEQLIASDGTTLEVHSWEGFCAGFVQLIRLARDLDELDILQARNANALLAMRSSPSLTTIKGVHHADILSDLTERRRRELQDRPV
jgi:hypothetical protein